ncbi:MULTISPECIES: PaaI family thioesterase [Gordonia]|uniref:Acyl-coenzyme A thioesterase THEM4 n=1 Tax=Gordonia hongkongensis TaxID=1701090 RepID=A0ABT6BWG5_9ACTN|nr:MULTISPECIES: PaaI family thioesterase [Gordonia]MCT1352002.1 PaaI family thioesterase [Gordonia sp. p3-SID1431]MDF6102348.1 PaaI family thioesterase [Gordonia hongkongensis]OCH79210.1 thioesterase [Gordonia sp. UCD-TK1]UPG67753.1 PaaI family thioesterase [Gordonia hongkongensis]WGJ85066.1 PaaI family thioesterase [Gordonia sp. SMJS1]
MTHVQAHDIDAFVGMIEAFRDLQATLCLVAPPHEAAAEMTAAIEDLTDRLRHFEVAEGQRTARELGMQGLGHPILVPYESTDTSDDSMLGSVTFGFAHMGSTDTVHGGVITLLFDDVLGMFVSRKGQPDSRTAFLKVDYRSATPVCRELRVTATIDSIEGRKTFVRGALLDGDVVCAEARALFVRLPSGRS